MDDTIINRLVAFVITPIVTALSGLGVVWVEDLLNTDLNDAEVAQLAIAVALVAGLQFVNWLRNLHDWQARKAGLKAPVE